MTDATASEARLAAAAPRWHLPALLLFTAVSRLAFIPPKVMGGDGPDYVNALKLDASYAVPPPGNIGYVLFAKLLSFVLADPVVIYALVATALSCLGAFFLLKLSRLLFTPGLALATTLCVMTSAQVWYHGVIMQSYIVWLATLPMIGYFCVKLARERAAPRWQTLVAAASATGLSTILRPDLVAFAGPLLAGGLLLGRCRLSKWAAAGVICAACCCVWLFATAHVLGSLDRYLELVRTKHEWHETYSVQSRGLFEGLGRNLVKYATFMFWTAHLALPLALLGVWRMLRTLRTPASPSTSPLRHSATLPLLLLLAALWIAPSLYFSWIIFMGNAGLVLPGLPLVYLAAAIGLATFNEPTRSVGVPKATRSVGLSKATPARRTGTIAMFVLAAINFVQFTLTPIPFPPSNQRTVLLTHMFFGYSGAGLRQGYTYELTDFGVDKSLGGTIKQFLRPEPVPKMP
jgi:hypothetical protein